LKRQIDQITKRIDTMTKQKTAYQRKALESRKLKKENTALQYMKLAKKFDELINSAYSTIHNLEMQQISLDSAADNAEILKVSRETAKVLRGIREETHDADEVIMELQDELDTQRDVQDTMISINADYGIDEDELILELEKLTVEEEDTSSGPGTAPVSEHTGSLPPQTSVPFSLPQDKPMEEAQADTQEGDFMSDDGDASPPTVAQQSLTHAT
jgi:hypothetical protein